MLWLRFSELNTGLVKDTKSWNKWGALFCKKVFAAVIKDPEMKSSWI